MLSGIGLLLWRWQVQLGQAQERHGLHLFHLKDVRLK